MKIVGTNITGSVLVNGNDVTTNLQTLNTWSGSVAGNIVSLNAYTASQNNNNSTYATTASLNSFTASQNVLNGTLATTGSNNFVGTQYVSNASQATAFTATASLYTDGGLRVTKDVYISGSTYVAGNLVVYGTSSIEYVTSSALVGLEYIDLNTDTPALRYAGIRVFDSGSISGITGSLLWDSQNNKWIYSNPSTVGYSGGMLISDPRASSLGSEEGTTNNALMKGQGGDHITSSAILDDGTSLRIPYLTIVTGTVGATTFSGSGANLTSIPNAALSNSSITVTAGTGLSGGGSVSLGSSITLTNTITNTNQLTNGAGFITSTGTAAAINQTVSAGTEANLVYSQIADNDFFRIRVGGSSNSGFAEIATADDGTEPIYVRQYTGTFSSLTRTATILDGSGNTSFPGVVTAGSDMRAPIFYDSNDTGYYLDPNSTSNSALRIRGGTLHGPNTTWGAYLYVGTNGRPGSEACVAATNGNLHMDSANGYAMYLNYYSGQIVYCNASFLATGDVTAYGSISDIRKKENIEKISNPIDKVKKLDGVMFNYKDTPDKRMTGVIAQQLLEVLPEVVYEETDMSSPEEKGEREKYYAVRHGNIVGLLIEAIKEQQAQIEELKAKLG